MSKLTINIIGSVLYYVSVILIALALGMMICFLDGYIKC